MENITIQHFQPENQTEVKDLILAGLTEHWGSLDPLKNPDLEDIGLTYARAVFLVAWQQGRVIGTGALLSRGKETGEIVRMSVAADMRRMGVGSRIFEKLCTEAKDLGMHHLVLETTETWQEAIAFYQGFGFQVTHCLHGDVYFRLEI